ncbi:tRNA pseudouridine(38-40) synthase TruA [Anaerolineales bacterium HSG6]|nr:tRNA pseudouridine(38-40) synthase TruA [Anaerolineales bacterium HSG6]MDM8530062.1 tRNA pseudouridine(38-40) synthase TruA [Anaerolineales bacterium HSG25]
MLINLESERYCAVIEYDGTLFHGYQIQPDVRTVQGSIEKTLTKIMKVFTRVSVAGRTDAGVHATGQVIAFDAVWRHSTDDLRRALNSVLPHDIFVKKLVTVLPDFSPRYAAIQRSYRYVIVNDTSFSVFERFYSHYIRSKLNLALMREASTHLIGTYDFSSFGKPPQIGGHAVRRIMAINWFAKNNKIFFDITANAFLYHMVRNIVGTLVLVGLNRLIPDDVRKILLAKDLKYSGPTAPAQGLYLMKVVYPNFIISG